MKRISTLIFSLSLLAATFVSTGVYAANGAQSICEGSGGTWTASVDAPGGGTCASADGRTVPSTLQQLTDVMIFLVGAIAVIMIIIGAIRYVTSAGDQTALTSAKNTILYSIIGIIVAIMAYALVHFVFTAFNIK